MLGRLLRCHVGLNWIAYLVLLSVMVGCRQSIVTANSTAPLEVAVSQPVQRDVTQYKDFIGRTEAVDSVEIKPRVTGYLLKTPFDEGSEVTAGEILCEIDPRSYQAQFDAAEGEVAVAQAKYQLAKTENERAKDLYQKNPQAISLKALDQHQAEEDAAAAQVAAAKSNRDVYKLNLSFTKVTSPIAGRVGRYETTIGNLVTENATTLTTVVSQDPIYAYFNIDEQTMLKALRLLEAGDMPPVRSQKIPIGLGLQDEKGYPHLGTADFADNTVDPSTGTLTVRASFANPANANGLRLLMPGMFVRIRMPLGNPRPSLLVAERAIGTDQGQKYVYVVDDQGKAEYRQVELGAQEGGGLRVVSKGLNPDDWVLVDGLQLVTPKSRLQTKQVPMLSTAVLGKEKTDEATGSGSPTNGG